MKVCVIGAGNIGMRYVEGITATLPDAEVHIVDRPGRIDELANMQIGDVRLATSLDEVDAAIDLFAVATSCKPRLSIYRACLERQPRFVILEKYLFASREEFDACLALARVPTFVNQWMYSSGAFEPLFAAGATSVVVSGAGWGLACNAVHWIDVLQRHMRMSELRLGSGTTVTGVFASKRPGYEEIAGELVFVEADGEKSFRLIDTGQPNAQPGLGITVDGREFLFDFSSLRRHGTVVSQFPYFSSLIGGIVGDLMASGRCPLPTLEESVAQHLLIEEVLEQLDHRPNVT